VILVPVSAETSEAVTRPPNLVMAPSRGLDGSSAGAHDKGGELRLLRSSGWLGARLGERRREYECALLLSKRARSARIELRPRTRPCVGNLQSRNIALVTF